MNQETYQALKGLLTWLEERQEQRPYLTIEMKKSIEQVEDWINEVAREYDN